ncbi:putative protein [Arabidopsis thaliana]|uniref:Uncharacterized protein AT4g11710 n=1 Tax=Arabidopsis thaliana TaxID=3702 RepID=Q9T0D8_ARATH|nr:putative protein [Arabidopsis thaliana]CAB78214.1 putative protein [Arabidopsis thaliana]
MVPPLLLGSEEEMEIDERDRSEDTEEIITLDVTHCNIVTMFSRQKICSWSARFLSYAGRLNLISSVLWSICNFWMGAFRLPRDCIREIDKMCSAYLWSGGELNTSKAKITWAFVCKPKEEGGLGLRSLKEANDVCCLKLIWRIISHADSLWVKWIQSSLLKKVSFWAVRENTSLGSWMWRKILKFRDIARTLCKVEINNGARTSFWYDDWSDLGRLIDSAGDRGAIDLGINKHATVVEAWGNRRRRRHRTNFLNRVEERLILSWNSRNQAEDRALWKGKENRFRSIFSTKDTWNHIRTVSNKVAWYKGVWFAQAIPKHAFCMWLAVHNRLSTGDRMTLWNMGVDATCILCNKALESRDHLFFSCPFATEIWEPLAKTIYNTCFYTDWQTIINNVSRNWPDRIAGFLARCILQVTIYTLWRERNERKHGASPNSSSRLISWIDKHIRNHLMAIKQSGDRRFDRGFQVWLQREIT